MSTTPAPKKQLRAGQMTIILVAIMLILLGVLGGGSILAASTLLSKSTDATHAQIDADISSDDANRLEALKQYLAKNATGIAQTKELTAGLGTYDQNSIVATLSGYASKAGVNITSFDFSAATATPTTPANNGSVNVTVASPVPYKNFIVFLRLIEQGLMPAQITNTQISGSPDGPGTVIVSTLTIQVAQ